ncbi:MAG: DEAD/DEAH box helicase [Planctomycetes bacterium]|nr:DEAD/DEAH box helicase [Planctomycetota bacterium]
MGEPIPVATVGATRADEALPPTAPLTALRGVGPATARRLAELGIATLSDLVLCFPRRLRELVEIATPRDEFVGRLVRLEARVIDVKRRFLPGRRALVEVAFAAADATPLRVAFFNQPWLAKVFAPGLSRGLEGLLERDERGFELRGVHVFDPRARPAGACAVRYREIDGVSAARLQRLIAAALRVVAADQVLPGLPAALRDRAPSASPAALLRAMHAPRDLAEHEAARSHFALLEAVQLFRRVERVRRARATRSAPVLAPGPDHEARLRKVLGFEPTADQRRACAELRAGLARPVPMAVLLQGDVGTGKTAVALDAALVALASGHQVALLAPTELLAEQHHQRFAARLAADGIRVGRLSASLPKGARRALEQELATGELGLVIGTHALLGDTTRFARLGLVIVDEQHRFGVEQRAQLARKGEAPHVLVMSATPIPRTLTLARFGDLDVVELRERPFGRAPARAVFVPREDWARVLRTIDRHVRRSGRVYVVCPRIGADGEKGGTLRLTAELAARARCATIHGRMDPAERRTVTERFRAGELDVLIGTTVLEVGVDVPAATLVVVVAAEQFGLATLHQLRGRVGRGARRGLCVLCGRATARTAAIVASHDGFALAEADLRLRGAGELCGPRQSGAHDFGALEPLDDYAILRAARDAVRGEGALP